MKPAATAAVGIKTRDAVLLLLVLQTTAIVLLMRFSKTRAPIPGAGPPYIASAAVFMAEALKLPVCILMTGRSAGGIGKLATLLRDEVLRNKLDSLRCAVPAVAFTLQSNLLFVALGNLDAPTYQVTYQTKTVFTAVFSWLLLRRALKPSQWLALCLLCIGGVLVSDLRSQRAAPRDGQSTATGLAAVLAAASLSASSSVYFEYMLKKPAASPAAAAASLWLRNIQLGLFALPLSALAMLLNDGAFVATYGIFQGFDLCVWCIVLLNGAGGLLVAATMKYADNIVKCFAAALAILTGTLLSIWCFDFHPSPLFSFGCLVTIGATILYAWAPEPTAVCPRGEGGAGEGHGEAEAIPMLPRSNFSAGAANET